MDAHDLEVLAWRLFEESNDAMFIVDPQSTKIVQANPAAQRLTHRRWREMRDMSLEQLIGCDGSDGMVDLLKALSNTGISRSLEDYHCVCQGTETVPVSLSVSRVHAPSGVLGLVVARDMSQSKRVEHDLREFGVELQRQVDLQTEDLRQANEKLEAEVAERLKVETSLQKINQRLRQTIGQLERAQEQAIRRERLHALEQIAGGIAHDINNSLAAVTAFSELILTQEDESPTIDWAEGIHQAAQDITSTVERLRQFYGEPVDQDAHERIELERLVRDVVHLTSPKWRDESLRQRKEIDVSVDVEQTPSIVADGTALRSVMTNLIFNAVDAIAGNGEIRIKVSERASMAVVEIKDNGSGMTHEQRRRCLEPFYTTKQNGTGLGLSVCHGIIKSLGGRMELDSERGEGTRIRLLLPTAVAGSSPAPQPHIATHSAQEMQVRLRGKRVLYIDDNHAARISTAALLQSLGIEVNTSEDGANGLEMFINDGYDVVITDLSMPGMDGLQVTAEIKRREPSMPVIMISGWPVQETRRSLQSAKPDSVLSKPFSSLELTNTLDKLLDSSAAPPSA